MADTPPTPPGDDDLTALLAPFRAGAESLWAVPPDDRLTAALKALALTGNDVWWIRNAADLIRALPSLVAAVDEVLKIHRPAWNDYADGDGIERASNECVECEPPGTPDNWPCPTVRAIRTALKGESRDDR